MMDKAVCVFVVCYTIAYQDYRHVFAYFSRFCRENQGKTPLGAGLYG